MNVFDLGYSNGDHRNYLVQFRVPTRFGGGQAVVVLSDGVGEGEWNQFRSGLVHRLESSEGVGMDLDYDSSLDPLDDHISEVLEAENPSSLEGALKALESALQEK